MSRFVLVRGWIECSFDQVPTLRKVVQDYTNRASEYEISEDAVVRYARAWIFPEQPLNWTSLVFFGASMREAALQWVRDTLIALGQVDPDIAGLFHVDDDEGEITLEWQLAEGKLTETGRA